MTRNPKPELASHHATRAVCALAAAVVTWTQFSAVVSIAEVPPLAMAGQRSNETFVKAAGAVKLAQAQPDQTLVVAR